MSKENGECSSCGESHISGQSGGSCIPNLRKRIEKLENTIVEMQAMINHNAILAALF